MFCIIAVQTLRAPQERYRIPEGVQREELYKYAETTRKEQVR